MILLTEIMTQIKKNDRDFARRPKHGIQCANNYAMMICKVNFCYLAESQKFFELLFSNYGEPPIQFDIGLSGQFIWPINI